VKQSIFIYVFEKSTSQGGSNLKCRADYLLCNLRLLWGVTEAANFSFFKRGLKKDASDFTDFFIFFSKKINPRNLRHLSSIRVKIPKKIKK
jgi:hypothetical protein